MTILGLLIGISLSMTLLVASAFAFTAAAIAHPAAATAAMSSTARVITFTTNCATDRSYPICCLPSASPCTLSKTRPGSVGLTVGVRVGKVGMVVVGLYWVVGKVNGVVGGRVGNVGGVGTGDEVWS